MRFNLRNFVLAPVVMAAAALATNTATAETTLKVPFNFTVGNKICPAGNYSVDQDITHSVVTLKSKETSRTFSWLLRPGSPAPTAKGVTLRFDEQGDAHALQTVQYGPLITGNLDKGAQQNEFSTTRTVQGEGR